MVGWGPDPELAHHAYIDYLVRFAIQYEMLPGGCRICPGEIRHAQEHGRFTREFHLGLWKLFARYVNLANRQVRSHEEGRIEEDLSSRFDLSWDTVHRIPLSHRIAIFSEIDDGGSGEDALRVHFEIERDKYIYDGFCKIAADAWPLEGRFVYMGDGTWEMAVPGPSEELERNRRFDEKFWTNVSLDSITCKLNENRDWEAIDSREGLIAAALIHGPADTDQSGSAIGKRSLPWGVCGLVSINRTVNETCREGRQGDAARAGCRFYWYDPVNRNRIRNGR